MRASSCGRLGEPTPDRTRRRNQARARMRGLSKTAATVEVAVLAGNRPHPSTPRGRPKRCRASVFPPIVHESGTARPDEFSSLGLGPRRHDRRHDRGGGDGGLGARPPPRSTPPPRQRWWCWRSWGKAATPLNTATLELAAVIPRRGD